MRCTSVILSGLAAIAAAAPASEVISNFDRLSTITQDLQTKLDDLTPINVITRGPRVIESYREIITTTSGYVRDSEGSTDTYADPDATNIVSAYNNYVTLSRNAFNTLIGKAGIISLTPFAPPIAAVLRVNEAAQDSYAFTIEDALTASQSTFKDLKTSFDDTESDAIDAYSNRF